MQNYFILKLSFVFSKATKENLKTIYTEIKKNENLRDYYMKCLSFLQVNFVKQQPPKVKSVIRLLKYWIKTKQVNSEI